MSVWKEVCRLARQRHNELCKNQPSLVPAATLLAAAQAATQIKVIGRPAGDTLLDGAEAAYDREQALIYHSLATPADLLQFHLAHEFGHHWLDEAGASCAHADIDALVPSEPEMSSVGNQDSYSPKERAEAQANLFAREFLLPHDKLRTRCADGIPDADAIASELGVPVDLVMQQLTEALLLPPEAENEVPIRQEAAPDDSQQTAITAGDGPRQVRAGPGTGKTRTLVGRVVHLIDRGEDPSTVVALTYSNLAAQDLSARIRAAIGLKATAVWSGTFHAYGLELLRKHGHALGFEAEPRLLDRTDSLMLLEELLPELQLAHYLDLREPILKLRSVLNAIGRAKDELASPEDYLNAASAMAGEASDDDEVIAAERAIEAAHVYAAYEAALRQRGLVDFGDLVALPIKLLREHPEIREQVRTEKKHVLVDEYQDMNRASGVLLQELCAPGRGPWVVGDVRQSIYRFRGASPLNMANFAAEFPGAETTDLSVNYRSGGRIVRLFESFGNQMAAAASASSAKVHCDRGEHQGTVEYDVATTRDAEFHGISQAILARVKQGKKFSDHAVLARSHITLGRLARQLEDSGVPCLYFGDFFERPEIRDLLSLLSVASEPKGIGLLRVAQLPSYAVPFADIRLLFESRRQQERSMLAVLRDLASVNGLSEIGRAGLERLAEDLRDSTWPLHPHRLLTSYLLRRSAYLSTLLTDSSVAAQQRRVAIYQLLQFAFAYRPSGSADPKRAFLDHVRRLEVLDEGKELRQLPAAVGGIDAVRLMTVHSSKGLEFPIVHIPTLTATQFPVRNRHDACPLPPGIASLHQLMCREAEEDSLFFVAVSRAEDTLHLSRAQTNGKVRTKPSRMLEPVAKHLPRSVDSSASWNEDGVQAAPFPLLVAREAEQWTARELETYLHCPRRFYYDHALELYGEDASSPFLKFQKSLHSTLSWMRAAASANDRRNGLTARIEEDWQNFGPADHSFAPLYRRMAEAMLDTASAIMDGESLITEREVLLPGIGIVVSCRADHIQRGTGGIVIRRLKAGRLAKTEDTKPRFVLVQAAMRVDHPGERVVVEHISLLNRDSQTGTEKKVDQRLAEYEEAIKAAATGEFAPKPNQYCPSCPYFFVCPSHGDIRTA